MRLEGKIAIITGAGSGIGRASAIRFAAEGAKVICADLKGQDETASEIGEAALGIQADAGSEDDVQDLVQAALQRFGGLDVFFANAGISGGLASIFEQGVEDWQEILRVNLIGPSLAIKHAAPPMRENGGGSIVCTASVAGLRAG
ncbi:MAG TPA: SDR family NAD(P)-dependent oxidoreductase, partial [Allosphingosinicella sp.]